ncbi:hypothetical protein, partial [Heyndrickxia acidicola]|nr:hypothetical protein [Heyndrickxia acidicola]
RVKKVSEILNDFRFKEGFGIQKKPEILREKLLCKLIKYKLSVLSYLLFGPAARFKRKIK